MHLASEYGAGTVPLAARRDPRGESDGRPSERLSNSSAKNRNACIMISLAVLLGSVIGYVLRGSDSAPTQRVDVESSTQRVNVESSTRASRKTSEWEVAGVGTRLFQPLPDEPIRLSLDMKWQTDWIKSQESTNLQKFVSIFDTECSAGNVFVDSGANDGLWSLLAAKRGCRVVAIEPQQRCLNYLAAAISENSPWSRRIELYNNVLAPLPVFSLLVPTDTCAGTQQFIAGEGGGTVEDAFKGAAKYAPNLKRGSALVESISLDELIGNDSAPIALWHIDTEGAEIGVLRSAEKLFARRWIQRVSFEFEPSRWNKFGVSIEEGIKVLHRVFNSNDWTCSCVKEGKPFNWNPNRGNGCADVYCDLQ